MVIHIDFVMQSIFVKVGDQLGLILSPVYINRLILGLRPANERRHYKVTASLIGWAQTYVNGEVVKKANSIAYMYWIFLNLLSTGKVEWSFR